ncbi:MAG: ribonuclease HI [Desulfococcaceae bacterium]
MPKKFYAVARGKNPGIYTRWFGPGGAHEQVNGFAGAVYKGFPTMEEAREFVKNPPLRKSRKKPSADGAKAPKSKETPPASPAEVEDRDVLIYTDGGALGNPGPGGYGVVILEGDGRRELSGGRRLTTNNRMEMMAVIEALEACEPGRKILLFSDSRYVVDAISKGWAKRWRSNNWMRNKTDPAVNPDLWERLLDLVDRHDVRFGWVKGHAGVAHNERCDELVRKESAKGDGLPRDGGYEGKT